MLWLIAILLPCKTHGERYFQKFPTVFIVCGLNNMKGLFFYSRAHCYSPSSCHSTLLVPPFHPSSYHFIPLRCRKLLCYLVGSVPFLNVVSFCDLPLLPRLAAATTSFLIHAVFIWIASAMWNDMVLYSSHCFQQASQCCGSKTLRILPAFLFAHILML